MKQLYITILAICYYTIANAQIGINTDNPQSIFHIDTQKNNPPTGIPSKAQQKDDFVVKIDQSTGINLGIGVIPEDNSSTQLELGSNNKTFLTNKVALTSTKDITTVPSPSDGMFVYNTSSTGNGIISVVPGLYYYDGIQWNLVLTSALGEALTIKDLQSDASTTADLNSSTQEGATDLDFGDIDIYQSGSYAFAFRLYGPTSNDTSEIYRGIFYIWIYVNDILTDFAEMNTPLFTNKQPISYSVVLGITADTGDKISFQISKYGDSSPTDFTKRIWTLKAAPGEAVPKTSLLYWRL